MLGINFSSTLSLGWLIVIIFSLILGGLFGLRDRSVKRWRNLYELADAERKELQAKLDEVTAELVKASELIAKLDAMQMPIRVVELMSESVQRIDDHARERLDTALERLQKDAMERDRREQERHEALMAVMHEVKGTLLRINGHS